MGGVHKSLVVCTSRGWCKQVVGGVNKSWVVRGRRGRYKISESGGVWVTVQY